jgi:hypothetical protein
LTHYLLNQIIAKDGDLTTFSQKSGIEKTTLYSARKRNSTLSVDIFKSIVQYLGLSADEVLSIHTKSDIRIMAANDDQSLQQIGVCRLDFGMIPGNYRKNNVTVIQASDDVMAPTINVGEPVFYYPQNFIEKNGIFLIRLNNSIIIRRVQKDLLTNKLCLICDNHNYEKIEIDANDKRLEIIGEIFAAIKPI